MKNTKNKTVESAEPVLTNEVIATEDKNQVAKPKKRKHSKKTKQVVIVDTPIIDVVIEKEELKEVVPVAKLNVFQRMWNSFVKWYNA